MYLLAVLLTRRCRAGDMAGLRPLGVRLGWGVNERGRKEKRVGLGWMGHHQQQGLL